ncbi:MAG: hypothetical protein IJ011_06400, partial [Clostridia bacterium]|nr:hypothetical protein [Clostridia bacterium]
MVNYNKAGAWTLIVHMIAGALWGLLRGVVVVIANFAAAQGFWAVVGAILAALFIFALNILAWAIGVFVSFGFYDDNA